jgi:hypothetical protein
MESQVLSPEAVHVSVEPASYDVTSFVALGRNAEGTMFQRFADLHEASSDVLEAALTDLAAFEKDVERDVRATRRLIEHELEARQRADADPLVATVKAIARAGAAMLSEGV